MFEVAERKIAAEIGHSRTTEWRWLLYVLLLLLIVVVVVLGFLNVQPWKRKARHQ